MNTHAICNALVAIWNQFPHKTIQKLNPEDFVDQQMAMMGFSTDEIAEFKNDDNGYGVIDYLAELANCSCDYDANLDSEFIIITKRYHNQSTHHLVAIELVNYWLYDETRPLNEQIEALIKDCDINLW